MTSITDPEALKAMIKDDPKLKASILERVLDFKNAFFSQKSKDFFKICP